MASDNPKPPPPATMGDLFDSVPPPPGRASPDCEHEPHYRLGTVVRQDANGTEVGIRIHCQKCGAKGQAVFTRTETRWLKCGNPCECGGCGEPCQHPTPHPGRHYCEKCWSQL